MVRTGLTRRQERRFARECFHKRRDRTPCYHLMGGVCFRCWWREVTGRNARDKAAFIERARYMRDNCPPAKMQRREGGGWERVS